MLKNTIYQQYITLSPIKQINRKNIDIQSRWMTILLLFRDQVMLSHQASVGIVQQPYGC
jgi:hypothetical protein